MLTRDGDEELGSGRRELVETDVAASEGRGIRGGEKGYLGGSGVSAGAVNGFEEFWSGKPRLAKER